MVGVPGRSKACHNCRQRRIKCDEKRPGCQKCAKSSRICTGYQRKYAFVLTEHVKVAEQDNVLTKDVDSGLVLKSAWSMQPNMPLVLAKHADRGRPKRKHSMALNPTVQPTLSGLWGSQLFARFVDCYSPVSNSLLQKHHWLQSIQSLPSWNPALEYAALAATTARLGRCDGSISLARQSLIFYTKSLHELRKALAAPAGEKDDQTLASLMLLLLYEVYECPGKISHGYTSHYSGCVELIRARGPDAHKSGLAHSMFRAFRLHTMFQGLFQRRPTFLADQSWLELPWRGPRNHFDELLDLLLELPGLLSDADTINLMVEPRAILEASLATVSKAKDLEVRLYQWFDRTSTTLPGELYHARLSTYESQTDDPVLGKVFPIVFNFPSILIAQTLLYYWMGIVVVCAHICKTNEKLNSLLVRLTPVQTRLQCTCGASAQLDACCLQHFGLHLEPRSGTELDWPHKAALNICYSIEYFLQSSNEVFAPTTALPVLAVVVAYWKSCPEQWTREITWIDEVFEVIGGTQHGLSMYNLTG